jgi:preprotein translocase subunit SecF
MRAISGARRIEAVPATELRDKPRLYAVEPNTSRSLREKVLLAIMVASFSVFVIAFATYVVRPALNTVSSSESAPENW